MSISMKRLLFEKNTCMTLSHCFSILVRREVFLSTVHNKMKKSICQIDSSLVRFEFIYYLFNQIQVFFTYYFDNLNSFLFLLNSACYVMASTRKEKSYI